jgi:simple sugar transport system permease protein
VSRLLRSPRAVAVATSVFAIVVGLAISLAVIAASGVSATESARALVEGAFGGSDQVAATVARMIPLAIVALAWIASYSGGLFSIGFQGQIIAGGICAVVVALMVPAPAGLHLLLGILAGVAAGVVWAGIAALLWARRGVNEIVSTLMLNFIAIYILSWVVLNPLKTDAVPDPITDPIPKSARWPELVEGTGLNFDLLLLPFLVVGLWLLLNKTTYGFRLRLSAANEPAARAAGVHTVRVRSAAFLLSGALAGLVGTSLVLGSQTHSMSDGFEGTYGYEGIAVALVALNSPLAVIPSALLFSALHQGGVLMEVRLNISSSLVLMTQGIVIVLVTGAAFLSRRVQAYRVDAEHEAAERAAAT